MDTEMCPECRKYTELVSDRAAGDLVCSECGLVLASRTVDETSEWRTFSNEAAGNDPERVGGPDNPHLTGGGLGTKIAGVNGSDMPAGVRSWATRAANPDKGLISAFQQITAMVDRLVLISSGVLPAVIHSMSDVSFCWWVQGLPHRSNQGWQSPPTQSSLSMQKKSTCHHHDLDLCVRTAPTRTTRRWRT